MKEKGNINIEKYIYGENVTRKYIDLYKNSIESTPLEKDETMANIVVYKDKNSQTSDMRLSCRVDVYSGEERIDFGYSPSNIDDNNNLLKFRLKKDKTYNLKITNSKYPEQLKSVELKTGANGSEDFLLTFF